MLSLIPIETFLRDCGGLLFAPLTQFPHVWGIPFPWDPEAHEHRQWIVIHLQLPMIDCLHSLQTPCAARLPSRLVEHLRHWSMIWKDSVKFTTFKIFMYIATAILFEVQTLTFKHKSCVQNFEPNCVDKSNAWTILSDIRQSKASPSRHYLLQHEYVLF